MSLHLIYWTFLKEVACFPDRRERYISLYYKPNKPFLRNYFRFWARIKVAEILAKFDELYPPDLLDSLENLFPLEKTRKICGEVLPQGSHELGLEEDIDVYVMVGVYTSNAFTTFVAGRPMVGIGLEHFDHRPNKHPWSLGDKPENLPIWLYHEMAHAARWGQGSFSPLRKALEEAGEFSWEAISRRIPLLEWLWSEGVAVAFSYYMTGSPLHNCLGFCEEKLAFCQENEEKLWQEFFKDKDRTDLEAYFKWFSGSELTFERKIPPERAGYYLGFRAVESVISRSEARWAELSRLSFEKVLAGLNKVLSMLVHM